MEPLHFPTSEEARPITKLAAGTQPGADAIPAAHTPVDAFLSFPLLPNRRLSDEIARYIRDGIIGGIFPANLRMAPLAIAERLGVSTMPVREALVTLVGEGLIEVLPRRGFRVAVVRRQDIADVFRVHAFVAGQLAASAATTIETTVLERLEAIQNEIVTVSTHKPLDERTSTIETLNFQFHRTINNVPDANRLRWFLRTASRYVPRHFYEAIPGWVETTLADHPAIIDALRRRDAADAGTLMETHVLKAGRLVLAKLGASSGAVGPAGDHRP
ncbi:MAG TPA: GntR family transcriptional regulator [bacterium]|nr:GntR family transcriptional regulator [bacterium]